MSLADFLNIPTEITLDGETFPIRPPNQLEQGQFQRWVEQQSYDATNRGDYQSDTEKQQALDRYEKRRDAGDYEWGSELGTRRLFTKKGLVKFLQIICQDQGLDEKKAEKLVEAEGTRALSLLVGKATTDPKVVEAIEMMLGWPKGTFSSASATPPSTSESTTSPPSPTAS